MVTETTRREDYVPPLLRADEVAEIFGVSLAALYESRRQRKAPGVLAIKIGRSLRWDAAEIIEWVEAQKAERGV